VTRAFQASGVYYIDAEYIYIDTFCGQLIGKGSASESYDETVLKPSALLARLEESPQAASNPQKGPQKGWQARKSAC
jgi:hypothetical protein